MGLEIWVGVGSFSFSNSMGIRISCGELISMSAPESALHQGSARELALLPISLRDAEAEAGGWRRTLERTQM